MSFDKHNNFVQEMTVTFSTNKVNEDGDTVVTDQTVPTDSEQPQYTTGYVAVDQFSNAANDMIKNFLNPVDGGSVGEMDHVVDVPELNHVDTGEEMDVEHNQIGFEYADGKLHISIDGNDIYLSKDAIESLKDYLSNIDVTDVDEDSEESDDDSNEESEDNESEEEEPEENDEEKED